MTVIGMGLTFGALGLLIVAMMALTRWAGGRGKIALLKAEPSKAIPADERVEELERAAAIAVAVALAQAARRAGPAYAWHTARPEEEPSPWQAYARCQQLEQAKTHQTLRW
jgi:Na+-transporting methylmalonyl-CoA/oxaloacetate decarboxylase gamma subunit